MVFSLISNVLLASSLATASVQEMYHCPHELKSIVSGSSLYIGELHGTNETPKLVECIVLEALSSRSDPITVSLELPEIARDPHSDFWCGQDGRSSHAMWLLVKSLIELEMLNKVKLHFQYGAYGNPVADEDRLATFESIAKDGFLVAYTGNFHSRKALVREISQRSSNQEFRHGELVHVSVESIAEGEAWVCGETGCGLVKVPDTSISNAKTYGLVDGSIHEHDFIFFVPRFTASPPQGGNICKP